MTENDILSDIGFCKGVITALVRLCRSTMMIHNSLYAEHRGLELFVSLLSAVSTPAVQSTAGLQMCCFSVGVLIYVPVYSIPSVVCWSVVCVVINVVLFYMVWVTDYCSPIHWHL